MNITVLGHGPVKRKDVTTALDAVSKGVLKEVTVFLPGTKDEFSDAARFAADWAYDMNVPQVYLAPTADALVELELPDDGVGFAECNEGCAAIDCAIAISEGGTVLVAWDDAEVSEIEAWVKATGGKVLDLTAALAEISLEGVPDEAQQPSNERVVSKEPTAVDVIVASQEATAIPAEVIAAATSVAEASAALATATPLAARTREEEIELIELGKAARTLLDYVVARVGGSY